MAVKVDAGPVKEPDRVMEAPVIARRPATPEAMEELRVGEKQGRDTRPPSAGVPATTRVGGRLVPRGRPEHRVRLA